MAQGISTIYDFPCIDWDIGSYELCGVILQQMVNSLERHMGACMRQADDSMLGLDESQCTARATIQELGRRLRGRDRLDRRRKFGKDTISYAKVRDVDTFQVRDVDTFRLSCRWLVCSSSLRRTVAFRWRLGCGGLVVKKDKW